MSVFYRDRSELSWLQGWTVAEIANLPMIHFSLASLVN